MSLLLQFGPNGLFSPTTTLPNDGQSSSSSSSSSKLSSIMASPGHLLHLYLLQQEKDILGDRVALLQKTHRAVRLEIYYLLTLYFLVQGLVLSWILQSTRSHLQCHNRWILLCLSIATYTAVTSTTFHKIRQAECGRLKVQAIMHQARLIGEEIRSLRRLGSHGFDIGNPPDPRLPRIWTPSTSLTPGFFLTATILIAVLFTPFLFIDLSSLRLLCKDIPYSSPSLSPSPSPNAF